MCVCVYVCVCVREREREKTHTHTHTHTHTVQFQEEINNWLLVTHPTFSQSKHYQLLIKSSSSAALTTYFESVKSKCTCCGQWAYSIYFIIKHISDIHCSYTNVRKGHPRVCTDARTIHVTSFWKTTKQFRQRDIPVECLVYAKRLLGPSICTIISSRCTTSLLVISLQGNACLWNGSNFGMNWIAFHCLRPEWILRNPLRFCQHTQHFSWQQNTWQNVLTDQK